MVTPNEPVSPLLSLLLPANLVKQGAEAVSGPHLPLAFRAIDS